MMKKTQQIANLLRTVSDSGKRIQKTSAVIVAAGASTRMGDTGNRSKQHIEIDSVPVVVRSLMAFQDCELISEIIVVSRENEFSVYMDYKEKYNLTKLKKVVAGGDTRQQSVTNGFDSIDPESKFVAIHDGARCLVTVGMIEEVCLAAYRDKAATAACRVRDTVKTADKNGFIDSTIDRSTVWLAQTPQVFYTPLYRAALYNANEENFDATDDNQLIERIKNPIKLVDCGSENIKITTPHDLIAAEQIINLRKMRDKL